MNIDLVKLTPKYRPQLNDMMEEWLAVEQDFSPYMIRRNDYRDFDYWAPLKTALLGFGRIFCTDNAL